MIDFSRRKIIKTTDGSNTLKLKDIDENFHSGNGAVTESIHIFINNGLLYKAENKKEIKILEVGLGTGLNALLSIIKAQELNLNIYYKAYEAFPLIEPEYKSLNYYEILGNDSKNLFYSIHRCDFDKEIFVNNHFLFIKRNEKIEAAKLEADFYDIVYFDAFAPDVQPELWTIDIFKQIYASLKNNGLLITYSAKGLVRRNLKSSGFIIEKLTGPPGKREITRAVKK